MRNRLLHILTATAAIMTMVWLQGCSGSRHVPQGSYLLDKVKITIDSGDRRLKEEDFINYLRQQPNHKMLWSMKFRLGIYNLSGKDTTKWWNRWIRKLGEAPVVYD
ncbi:MAG: outer membrane protein assembly factor, partial [Muribaculaceae bacterium]|nr:outer membrane protein assembly factor [Muribaculaceae bacterium]